MVYSQAEATLEIAIEAYTLDDNRGTDIVRYPIVKVGSQYWMRNDLSTAYDNLYNPIAVSNELNGTPALFKVADKEVYFYSGELINLHTLPYTGWAVPTDNDWIDLSSYVEGNASKVKTGTWSSAIEDATIRPATNETMLGINPVGTWWTSGFYGEGAMVGYWSLIEDTSEGDLLKAFTFKGETNSFDTASPFVNKETKDEYKAFSVRLIKK